MRATIIPCWLAALLLAGACGAGLRPAPAAAPLPGPAAAAVATDAGVRLEVRTGVEHRVELDRPVTAIYVVVDNRSRRDLVIRHQAFELVTPAGRRHPAIPSDALRRSSGSSHGAEIVIAMRALPNDVLGDGGKTEGFVYFDEIPTVERVTLSFELRAQDTGARFGLITVPLTQR